MDDDNDADSSVPNIWLGRGLNYTFFDLVPEKETNERWPKRFCFFRIKKIRFSSKRRG